MLRFKSHFTRGYIAGICIFLFGVVCHWFAGDLTLTSSNSFFKSMGNDSSPDFDLASLDRKMQVSSAMGWIANTCAILGFLFILITFWQWSKQVPAREERDS
jgi:hypothetical protein